MSKKRSEDSRTFPVSRNAYLRKAPIIPGRPLIPGRKAPPFPPFYRVEEKPVTFRSCYDIRSREEHEDCVIDWITRVRKERKLIVLMIPHAFLTNRRTSVFHAGWTLFERDGEIRTHQCVVFLTGEAIPLVSSDQGVICIALRASLSAWDGRTEDESRAHAS